MTKGFEETVLAKLGKLDKLVKQQSQFQASLDHMGERQDQFQASLDHMGERQDRFQVSLDHVSKQQDRFQVSLDHVSKRQDQFQKDLRRLEVLEEDTNDKVRKVAEVSKTQRELWMKALTADEADDIQAIHAITRRAVADHERRLKHLEQHAKTA